ncbi:MAG TPA: hypothetical protein VJ692_05085 [Nitrospiraceae bacterium]|nr:hypothetical protein [Nitrospiraceae bacterium]
MPVNPSDDLLESLTRRALQAAEQGQWNSVALCYAQRAKAWAGSGPSTAMAARLVEWDRIVEQKVRLAQAAVGQLLSDIATTRLVTARDFHRVNSQSVGKRLDRQI